MTDTPLTTAVKLKCGITYTDNNTNARIADIMASADVTLRDMLGVTDVDFDFADPGPEKTLYVNYCWYEFCGAVADFRDNYHELIELVRKKNMAEEYDETENET